MTSCCLLPQRKQCPPQPSHDCHCQCHWTSQHLVYAWLAVIDQFDMSVVQQLSGGRSCTNVDIVMHLSTDAVSARSCRHSHCELQPGDCCCTRVDAVTQLQMFPLTGDYCCTLADSVTRLSTDTVACCSLAGYCGRFRCRSCQGKAAPSMWRWTLWTRRLCARPSRNSMACGENHHKCLQLTCLLFERCVSPTCVSPTARSLSGKGAMCAALQRQPNMRKSFLQ